MPLYEYSCPQCGRFELIRKFADVPLKACPTCGKTVQKLLSAPAIQFKGTGWYITDYSRKSSGGDGGSKGDGSKEPSSPASDSTPSGGSAKEPTGSKASEKTVTKSSEKK